MIAAPAQELIPMSADGLSEAPLQGIGGRILIVDDDPAIRDLLRHTLRRAGYEVALACDGEEGMDKVDADAGAYDVVITDARMPRYDGFDLCRHIKSQPHLAHLPVLMITAYGERDHKMEGIAAGATDFITKPIDISYLALRVRNAIQVKRLHDTVQENYRRLQELESMRERLVRMLVHDMSGPLKTVLGDLDQLRRLTAEGSQACRESTVRASGETRRLIALVDDIAETAALEKAAMPVELDAVFLRPIIDHVLQNLSDGDSSASTRPAPVLTKIEPGAPAAVCDARLMRRVVDNLVRNALQALPDGGTSLGGSPAVEVGLKRLKDRPAMRLWVTDEGPSFPSGKEGEVFAACQEERRFEFGTRPCDGLGLRFCKLAIEAQGGIIGVDTPDGGRGATFWCDLPLA